jgi:hypothetical protein
MEQELCVMQRTRKPFNLPMMLTNLVVRDGKHVAHSLDFDLVCVADNDTEAWDNLCLAIKTYVEFGISKGWNDYIMFPAPQEFWDKITPDTPLQLRPPITIAGEVRKVVEAEVYEACTAA